MTVPAGGDPVVPVAGGSPQITAVPATPPAGPRQPAGLARARLVLLVLAGFGSSMALLAPMAYSLAVRVQQLAPGQPEVLGFVLGGGSVVSLLAAPVLGTLSDRTRTRLGRRRPWLLAGTTVGLAGIVTMSVADGLAVLTAGWVMTSLGWSTANGALTNMQADHLLPRQRGKLAGYTGFTSQLAAVVGILLAGTVSIDGPLLFLLPGLTGAAFVLPFLVLRREEDSRELPLPGSLTLGGLLRSFTFSPRAHPDFAWNWLGRFSVFLGVSLTTTFSTYFYAARLDVGLAEVAGFVAVTASVGIVGSFVGSLGAGWLSDRLGRRRPFVVGATVILASGATVLAFASSFATLLTGTALTSTGIAVFAAVNQAIVLDVLPERDTAAGRYMAIFTFSQRVPSSLAPFLSPVVITIGATAGGANYTLLYLLAAGLALIGGLVIGLRVRGVR
ncbi:MFS transporter [Modestobacter sp. VKM Ac-2984]|uniref:MFS transporter n=1 Tax=Modestobacter sp. VKM Ac-2984 TaxID=3004138 RepID=UPI0022AA4197|nr:MFS transporter [Modestobacter sp. VKM Ac-2984]MCZ2816339.1 MFS transporter [Modestobacter sp. VKM Ac-2984]